MKKYQLFLSKECSDCEKLLDNKDLPWFLIDKKWLQSKSSQNYFPIIVPALKKGDKLLAYGYEQISLILKSNDYVYKNPISRN